MFSLKIQTIRKLNKNKILETDLLIAKVLNKNRTFVLTYPNYKIKIIPLIKLFYYLLKLKLNYPLAYIIKEKEFFKLKFFVNKYCLIPRPDTEILVEKIISTIEKNYNEKITLIDIGTGSGCIPISIKKNTTKNIEIIASDISKYPLKLAKKNAKLHQVEINFIKSNLLKNFPNNFFTQSFNYLIITANLPYLSYAWYKKEKSIQKEPFNALVADNNLGLKKYKKLLLEVNKKIKNYQKLLITIEIDPRQKKEILKLINEIFPQSLVEIKKDLSGLERIVTIFLKN